MKAVGNKKVYGVTLTGIDFFHKEGKGDKNEKN